MERYQRALVGATLAAAVATLTSRAHCDEASAMAKLAAHEAGVSVARATQVEKAILSALPESDKGQAPLLMAIAIRESNLLPSVATCDVVGDGGRAFGLFQEHARGAVRDRICSGDIAYQAEVAYKHLSGCGTTEDGRVACYAGRAVTHKKVTDRLALASRLRAAK